MKQKTVEIGSIKVDFYWASKISSSNEEYEDAFGGPVEIDDSIKISIADGATESQFSRTWAENLCSQYCSTSDQKNFIDDARDKWIRDVELDKSDRLWYQQQAIEKGAYATFLGLTIDADFKLRLQSVGDCNLFVFTNEECSWSWPMSLESSFDNTPRLISSIDRGDSKVASNQEYWAAGETLLLATDAVSQHLLQNQNTVTNSLNKLENVFSKIQDARGHQIPDDDLTLLVIRRLHEG